MRKHRVLALVLACLLLTGCGPRRTEPLDPETAQAAGAEIGWKRRKSR